MSGENHGNTDGDGRSWHRLQRVVRHLVMFSGGVCSWAAAKRVVERHGADETVLLFADTRMEDEDLYRFLNEAAANVGAPLVRIADGRTPWDVMRDHHCIATSKIDVCSFKLKRVLLDKWRDEHCAPDESTIYVGLDWTESHRVDRMNDKCAPWRYAAPMAEAPYMTKAAMMDWLRSEEICPPRLYGMGFAHNNCGGFCVKAGRAAFANLLRRMPERYAWHEQQERELREWQSANGVQMGHVLYKDRNGKRERITMEDFRKEIEGRGDEFEGAHDWGGCGCAINA